MPARMLTDNDLRVDLSRNEVTVTVVVDVSRTIRWPTSFAECDPDLWYHFTVMRGWTDPPTNLLEEEFFNRGKASGVHTDPPETI